MDGTVEEQMVLVEAEVVVLGTVAFGLPLAATVPKASSSSPIRQQALITSSYSSNENVNVLYIRDIHICSC
jgi:hypothetical protein